jgi:F-type H+-transporting ATPase subunit gamma
MAGAKEIRTKIRSIQSTQKITKAMEMVAASKMRKAQDRMLATRPYSDKMLQVIGHLALAHPEYRHPYVVGRPEVKRAGLIVVSTDRGLCGGLNVNLFRVAVRQLREWRKLGLEVDLCTFGVKSLSFFKRTGANIIAEASHLGDSPHVENVIGPVKVMLDAYTKGEIDEVHLLGNKFVNTMTQKPQLLKLVPLPPTDTEQLKHHWDYIYEPDSREVIDGLMDRYIESLVYQAIVENVACEMAARMIAMKSATDNAGELIKELQLLYNKERQAAITQEISEIVGGAAAIAG